MKVLVVLALASGCLTDPPYRPYSQPQQTGYGPPPSQQQHGPYSDPNSPTGYSNYPTYQTNLNPAPTGPQPPPYVGSSQPQGGVTVLQSPPPGSPPPAGPPMAGPPPVAAPPPAPAPPGPVGPQPAALAPTVAGRYQCWVSGAGMYAQSSLGMITLDFNSSYSSTANAATPGTYRVDGNRVMFAGGPLASYVGVLESNRNGPLIRFRVEHPNDPGPQLSIGDHVCYLAR